MFKNISEKIKKLFSIFIKGKSDHLFVQFSRYFICVLISYIIDFSIYLLLTRYFNIYMVYANIMSRSLGMIVNYIISISWVFNKRKFDNTVMNRIIEFLMFMLFGIVGIVVNTFFIWLFTEILKIYDVISKLMSSLISYLFIFVLRKLVLFK